jgi:hypothetical protein
VAANRLRNAIQAEHPHGRKLDTLILRGSAAEFLIKNGRVSLKLA